MVLAFTIIGLAVLGVYGAYGYRETQQMRAKMDAIEKKIDKILAEEELRKIQRVSVLPKASRDEMVTSDYQAWYDEQRILRQVDPQSVHIDPDWDDISLDDKPLVRGI